MASPNSNLKSPFFPRTKPGREPEPPGSSTVTPRPPGLLTLTFFHSLSLTLEFAVFRCCPPQAPELTARAWCLPSSRSGCLSYQWPDKLPEVDKHMGGFTKSCTENFSIFLPQSFLLKEACCGLMSRCRNSSCRSTSSLLHVYIYICTCIFCSKSPCSLLNAEVNPPTPAPVCFFFFCASVSSLSSTLYSDTVFVCSYKVS